MSPTETFFAGHVEVRCLQGSSRLCSFHGDFSRLPWLLPRSLPPSLKPQEWPLRKPPPRAHGVSASRTQPCPVSLWHPHPLCGPSCVSSVLPCPVQRSFRNCWGRWLGVTLVRCPSQAGFAVSSGAVSTGKLALVPASQTPAFTFLDQLCCVRVPLS